MIDQESRDRLAYWIRYVMGEQGLSAPELAERVGVARSTVNSWMKGKQTPSMIWLGPLCRGLGVSPTIFADLKPIPASHLAMRILGRFFRPNRGDPPPDIDLASVIEIPRPPDWPDTDSALVLGRNSQNVTELEVVGESHHQRELAGMYLARQRGRGLVAELRPEPTNRADPNAVAVYVNGLPIGHLGRDDALEMKPRLARLAEKGRRCFLVGSFRGARKNEDGSLGAIGVVLDVPDRLV